jgi:hypothetical protein
MDKEKKKRDIRSVLNTGEGGCTGKRDVDRVDKLKRE